MEWQCLNCGKDFEGDKWFCCDKCEEHYMKFQQIAKEEVLD